MRFIQDFRYFKREKAKLSFSFEITKVLNKTNSIQDTRVCNDDKTCPADIHNDQIFYKVSKAVSICLTNIMGQIL